jgi:hypothetical protein
MSGRIVERKVERQGVDRWASGIAGCTSRLNRQTVRCSFVLHILFIFSAWTELLKLKKRCREHFQYCNRFM